MLSAARANDNDTSTSASSSSSSSMAAAAGLTFRLRNSTAAETNEYDRIHGENQQDEAADEEDVEFSNTKPQPRLFEYERQVGFDLRKAESTRIREKFPTRVPLVCERNPASKSSKLPELQKKKFLVPEVMTLAQFSLLLKQQMEAEGRNAAADSSLYFLLKSGQSPVLSKMLRDLYEEHCGPDGFLYLHMCEEAVFGGSLR